MQPQLVAKGLGWSANTRRTEARGLDHRWLLRRWLRKSVHYIKDTHLETFRSGHVRFLILNLHSRGSSSPGEEVRLSIWTEVEAQVSDSVWQSGQQEISVQDYQHQEAGYFFLSLSDISQFRTKREFLDELRECRDQIFDTPIKRMRLLESQARVKNVLQSVNKSF